MNLRDLPCIPSEQEKAQKHPPGHLSPRREIERYSRLTGGHVYSQLPMSGVRKTGHTGKFYLRYKLWCRLVTGKDIYLEWAGPDSTVLWLIHPSTVGPWPGKSVS